MKRLLVVLMLLTAVGCACAEESEESTEPEEIKQVTLGAYLITESTRDFDPSMGLAASYFQLSPRNWYISAEAGFYEATVHYTPEQPPDADRTTATVDVTTWAFFIGRAKRSRDGKSYVGAGIGWIVDDDHDLGYGVRFESKRPIGWEIIAGTTREPIGAQLRYHDGGMPTNTGLAAAISYSW